MRMEWSDDDLVALWTLVGEDWSLVGNKTGATQLKRNPERFTGYDWTGRTIKYHREQMRAAFGLSFGGVGAPGR